MKKLPVIILVMSMLFSSYFLWKANHYSQKNKSHLAASEQLTIRRIEMEKEIQVLKQKALESAAEAILIRNQTEAAIAALEDCKQSK